MIERDCLFRVLASRLSGLTRFGLNEKVDQKECRKECSEKNGKVGTELNLKRKSLRWEGVDYGVKSKRGSRERGNREGSSGSIEGS